MDVVSQTTSPFVSGQPETLPRGLRGHRPWSLRIIALQPKVAQARHREDFTEVNLFRAAEINGAMAAESDSTRRRIRPLATDERPWGSGVGTRADLR